MMVVVDCKAYMYIIYSITIFLLLLVFTTFRYGCVCDKSV